MFEDIDASSSPSQNNEFDSSCGSYIRRAAKACSSGDNELGLHLYLAAYEKGTHGVEAPAEDAAFALRKAWVLAVQLKERSLAEYIFEKLEPLLDPNELAVCASQLQALALEKLEEFGLSREDLQEMTEMISQDVFGVAAPGRLMKVEHLTIPSGKTSAKRVFGSAAEETPASLDSTKPVEETASEKAADSSSAEACEPNDDLPSDGRRCGDASAQAPGDDPEPGLSSQDPAEDAESIASSLDAVEADLAEQADSEGSSQQTTAIEEQEPSSDAVENADAHAIVSTLDNICYRDLAGFGKAIETMRSFGIGEQENPDFRNFVAMLNEQYGLERMPALDSFLFRAPAREDAHRFMTATLGELGLPVLRMHMEENLQGAPVLCVMAQADNHPRLNSARNAFEGPGVLMLEDLDLWDSPVAEAGEDFNGFMFPGLSRGAREAINLIRSAVENPQVVVLASASDAGSVDGFFYDLLEPLTVVDIEQPSDEERREIWEDIASTHRFLQSIEIDKLVGFSSGMPRFDIYMAAREAIEEAYKASLMQRRFVPVTAENVYEKLAAYQPLDSNEYHALEDAVVRSFGQSLDGSVDDLLKG